MASEKKKIVKSAFIVGAFTFLSRIFGLIRDTVTASLFGSTAATDALWVAFRIPNTLRRFVAEGNLTVSFVPVYTDVLMKQGREEAFRVGQITYTLLSILLLAMSLAGVVFSRYVIMFFAPGFLDDPAKFELTVLLNSIMFPYIFFAGTVALAMGILNSMGHFAAPAASPVLLNLAVIACSFGLYNHFDAPVTGFAVGVIIGGFAQLILQLRPLKRVGFRFKFNPDWRHPAVRKIIGLMLVAAFGVGVYQINVLIGTILASFLESGSVTYLQYAIHFSEFPQGIFVLSVATAVLPELSKRISEGNFEGFKDNFAFALTLISIITIPATCSSSGAGSTTRVRWPRPRPWSATRSGSGRLERAG
jgi:putative peptidoglycan lipid II flippase